MPATSANPTPTAPRRLIIVEDAEQPTYRVWWLTPTPQHLHLEPALPRDAPTTETALGRGNRAFADWREASRVAVEVLGVVAEYVSWTDLLALLAPGKEP